jgi:hypothetical protein
MAQRATSVLRQHFPEDHDLLVLCRHRLGMVAAAARDARSATALLSPTREHYQAMQEGHPLQHEAEIGLAMARCEHSSRLQHDTHIELLSTK